MRQPAALQFVTICGPYSQWLCGDTEAQVPDTKPLSCEENQMLQLTKTTKLYQWNLSFWCVYVHASMYACGWDGGTDDRYRLQMLESSTDLQTDE